MRRGKGNNRGNKPRQPGGNRQEAGPRHKFGKGRPHKGRPAASRGPRPERGERPHRHEQRERPFERKPERVAAPVREAPAPTPQFSQGVQTVTVSADENQMRVDRFFEARFPGLSFSHIQRIIRKGEVRVNGKRTEPKARLEAGQSVRIPPLSLAAPKPRDDAPAAVKDRAFLRSITLYDDDDVMVLNKPAGLAVQGGSGTTRHIDGMLGALQGQHKDAQRPRLVHRLDKDTAGCLLIAKTRFAAAALSKTFRSRAARKIYWALVAGVPKPPQGRISTYLAKQEVEEVGSSRVDLQACKLEYSIVSPK